MTPTGLKKSGLLFGESLPLKALSLRERENFKWGWKVTCTSFTGIPTCIQRLPFNRSHVVLQTQILCCTVLNWGNLFHGWSTDTNRKRNKKYAYIRTNVSSPIVSPSFLRWTCAYPMNYSSICLPTEQPTQQLRPSHFIHATVMVVRTYNNVFDAGLCMVDWSCMVAVLHIALTAAQKFAQLRNY